MTAHQCHGADPRGRARCTQEATEVAWRMDRPHAFCAACAPCGVSTYDHHARMPALHEMTPTLLLAWFQAIEERQEQLSEGIAGLTVQVREARALRESAVGELARRGGQVITR